MRSDRSSPRGSIRPRLASILAAGIALGCSSASVRPETPTRGAFHTEARAFHLLFLRLPRLPLASAMDRAGDLDHSEVRIDSVVSYPDLIFPFTLLNRILGYSGASVEGRYGERTR